MEENMGKQYNSNIIEAVGKNIKCGKGEGDEKFWEEN